MNGEVLFESLKKEIISHLDGIADVLIAEKTLKFQKELESKRNEVIGSILNSIEITASENQIEDKINIVLKYSPKIERK